MEILVRDIEARRDDLVRIAAEMARRVRSLCDWRARVRARPLQALVVAFGAGWLLGRLPGRRP